MIVAIFMFRVYICIVAAFRRFLVAVYICANVLPVLGAPILSTTNSPISEYAVELKAAKKMTFFTKGYSNTTLKYYSALINITTVTSQYIMMIDTQINRERKNICFPADKLGVRCHFPEACSANLHDPDQIFYCYILKLRSFLTDVNLLLNVQIKTDVKKPNVESNFLVPLEAPLMVARWFTMATLNELVEILVKIQAMLNSLQLP
ncbi:uncharacterized protein LOC115212847 [Argonauta hians]